MNVVVVNGCHQWMSSMDIGKGPRLNVEVRDWIVKINAKEGSKCNVPVL